MMVSTRQTAAERRVAVLSAAVTEFAKSGYSGTSTDASPFAPASLSRTSFASSEQRRTSLSRPMTRSALESFKELSRAIEGLDREEAMQAMAWRTCI